MTPRGVTVTRWTIVGGYGLTGFGLSLGGITAREFVVEVVAGVICLVGIVAADWINAGRRDGD